MERQIDEAVTNVRALLDEKAEKLNSPLFTDLHVRQKYMGHRNARYDYFLIFSTSSPQRLFGHR